ncbi:NAD+ synthase [Pelistega europaea]|uniref:Glutamine-dependent NAD(+) synthetase n=1 Tax=Pelistega europaea TaxID=106147 RepID=A0A7Y4P3F7_9BURK|nr:NAD+ synthase [Pelistega europaea]NOL48957.1 NAD+ synthase [Pelistega europaea]
MASSITIGLAQINPTVGALSYNVDLMVQAAEQAQQQGVEILVFPELALTGYQPEDLMYRPHFLQQHDEALHVLLGRLALLTDMHILVGHLHHEDGRLYNAASLIVNGQILQTYHKQALPNYGVFDEHRYFSPGSTPSLFTYKNHVFAIAICEDVWLTEVAIQAKQHGAQSLLVLNASPYTMQKDEQRIEVLRANVSTLHMNTFYCNIVGGQDDLVFDGNSFVLDSLGNVVNELTPFVSTLGVYRMAYSAIEAVTALPLGEHQPARMSQPLIKDNKECIESEVWRALMLATGDYCRKNGFKTVALGLSGGIDSAVVLAIAVDVLGKDNAHAVMMPSRYTADISVNDAAQMAKLVGVKYDEIAIAPMFSSFLESLAPSFKDLPPDTTEENIQARIRGVLMMAFSNKFGSLILTTGNKSELATGYCTLYGDMVGGFAVIKDIPKTFVYRLAKWRNSIGYVIPERIITRPPSAELRDNQTDQDSLPEYDVLDAILERMMEFNQSSEEIIAEGFEREAVEKIARLLRINEYKRRQGAPGPKITRRAFGRDWRAPITNGYRY